MYKNYEVMNGNSFGVEKDWNLVWKEQRQLRVLGDRKIRLDLEMSDERPQLKPTRGLMYWIKNKIWE